MSHETAPLGSFTVNRMGYGAMQLAGPHVFGPPKDRGEAIAVLRAAIEAGVNHIDTSDYYGPFVVNEIIREALEPYPDDLVLVTKVGALRGDDGSWQRAMSKKQLVKAIHDNLRRLGRERVDVVNLRAMFSPMGPAEGSLDEPLSILAKLQQQGVIKHIGLSNVTPKQVEDGRKIVDVVCVQNQFNLVHRGDDAMIGELAADGIAYVPFFPLGGFSPIQSDGLSAVAADLGATPMQVALAWLLQRSPNILLIPGTSSVGHLRENLAAADITLAPDSLERLEALVPAPVAA
ncbi:MAG: aldo/keto reductase family oxidoreductase [Sphingomicrobium sp.]